MNVWVELRRRLTSARDDQGSAVVEFALVTPLLLVLLLGVLQIALAMHVRATLTAAAAEGARVAALSGSSLSQGEQRTRDVLTESLAGGGVAGVSASRERLAGVEIVAVTVTASLPLIGLLGPTSLQVIGHAVREDS
ncbi:MAG: pilus assembly protein [Actinobacteria bacterium]|nr:pilus assembly protein [Actinomycetota bacterium]